MSGDGASIATRLRAQCENIRRKQTPLADLIPLMQQAADALDARAVAGPFMEDGHHTGLSREYGFILEGATAGELAAHDDGCMGMMAALQRILDGKDDGSGVSREPWESLRRRVLELVRERAVPVRMRFGKRASEPPGSVQCSVCKAITAPGNGCSAEDCPVGVAVDVKPCVTNPKATCQRPDLCASEGCAVRAAGVDLPDGAKHG